MTFDANAQSWTAAELLTDVRRKASLPVTSTDFTDSVLMREASDVLWSFAGWALQQAGEGRLVEMLSRPITAALSSAYRAAGEFDLPPLAIADTLEAVAWLNATGNAETRLQRIDPSVQSDFDSPTSFGSPTAYALLGGRIRLYPQPTTGGTLRVTYQRRHPALIADAPTDVLTVVSVAAEAVTGNTVITTTTPPLAPFAVGQTVDILSEQYPYRVVTASATVTTMSLSTLTVAVPYTQLSGVALANTRIVRAGASPYVHLPLELRPAVTEKVAANVMRIVGDMTGASASETIAGQELGRVLGMLSSRSKRDRPRAVNPYSHLRGGMRGGWRP